jgi:hypothetical protein
MTPKVKPLVRAIVVVLLIGLIPYGVAGSAAPRPHCGIRWGSSTKSNPDPRPPDTLPVSTIVRVLAGRNACFDRLAIDLAGADTVHWTVAYGDFSDPFYDPVRPRGGAILRIGLEQASLATYRPRNPTNVVNLARFRTLRQASIVGRGEAARPGNPYPYPEYVPEYVIIGLGVRARLPFRVFYLDDGPTRGRLVVDVAHRW